MSDKKNEKMPLFRIINDKNNGRIKNERNIFTI
jgi:hypothetical protein